jgi:hypothetical protein
VVSLVTEEDVMQIHQHVSHGLLYFIAPQDIEQLHLSDSAVHDEFDWEEYEVETAEGSLALHVVDFLKDIARK